jgi:uncharacterized NAD(P)/FAD-binding protein YdhS
MKAKHFLHCHFVTWLSRNCDNQDDEAVTSQSIFYSPDGPIDHQAEPIIAQVHSARDDHQVCVPTASDKGAVSP